MNMLLENIPQIELRLLCHTLLKAIERFYSDPANVVLFQEWKQSKEGKEYLELISEKQGDDNG